MTAAGNCPSLSLLSVGSGVARTVIVELSLDSSTDFVPRLAFRLFVVPQNVQLWAWIANRQMMSDLDKGPSRLRS
jgi:hypothetical protein